MCRLFSPERTLSRVDGVRGAEAPYSLLYDLFPGRMPAIVSCFAPLPKITYHQGKRTGQSRPDTETLHRWVEPDLLRVTLQGNVVYLGGSDKAYAQLV